MPNVLLVGGLLWIGGLLFATIAGLVALRRADTVARWFAMTLGLLALGAFGFAASVGPGGLSPLGLGIYSLVVLVVPVAWARFVFAYYGLFDFTSRRRTIALFAAPVLGCLAGTWVGLVRAGALGAASPLVGDAVYLWFAMTHFFAAGVFFVGIGLLLQTTLSRTHLEWTKAVALTAVVVGPWFGSFANGIFRVASVPTVADLGQWFRVGGFLVGAAGAAAVMVRHRLFDGVPAAATAGPETVLQEMDDIVIVTDRSGSIVRLNEAARQLFAGTDDVVGESTSAVLGTTASILAERDQVRLPTRNGPGYFDPSVTELTNERGDPVGETIVLRDVTEPHIRRQRLTVLNRVLRHNLRNETSTIVTRAEVIAEDADDRQAELAEAVAETALDIAHIGDKARRIERMMAVPDVDDPEADAAEVVRTVIASVRAESDCEVSLSAPDSAVVQADERLLRPVVEDAVENAIEHNDREEPTIEVTLDVAGEGPRPVEIAIADDGPGIPEAERHPLVVGQEAPLEHSSGLGLWGVKWGVTRMGGALEFEDNDPRGSIVRIGLPTPESAVANRAVPPHVRFVPADEPLSVDPVRPDAATRAATDGNGSVDDAAAGETDERPAASDGSGITDDGGSDDSGTSEPGSDDSGTSGGGSDDAGT